MGETRSTLIGLIYLSGVVRPGLTSYTISALLCHFRSLTPPVLHVYLEVGFRDHGSLIESIFDRGYYTQQGNSRFDSYSQSVYRYMCPSMVLVLLLH